MVLDEHNAKPGALYYDEIKVAPGKKGQSYFVQVEILEVKKGMVRYRWHANTVRTCPLGLSVKWARQKPANFIPPTQNIYAK